MIRKVEAGFSEKIMLHQTDGKSLLSLGAAGENGWTKL